MGKPWANIEQTLGKQTSPPCRLMKMRVAQHVRSTVRCAPRCVWPRSRPSIMPPYSVHSGNAKSRQLMLVEAWFSRKHATEAEWVPAGRLQSRQRGWLDEHLCKNSQYAKSMSASPWPQYTVIPCEGWPDKWVGQLDVSQTSSREERTAASIGPLGCPASDVTGPVDVERCSTLVFFGQSSDGRAVRRNPWRRPANALQTTVNTNWAKALALTAQQVADG